MGNYPNNDPFGGVRNRQPMNEPSNSNRQSDNLRGGENLRGGNSEPRSGHNLNNGRRDLNNTQHRQQFQRFRDGRPGGGAGGNGGGNGINQNATLTYNQGMGSQGRGRSNNP